MLPLRGPPKQYDLLWGKQIGPVQPRPPIPQRPEQDKRKEDKQAEGGEQGNSTEWTPSGLFGTPSNPLPTSSSSSSNLTIPILRYRLLLPFHRLCGILIGTRGSTRRTLIADTGLANLVLLPPGTDPTAQSSAVLAGTEPALRRALDAVEHLLYEDMFGRWTGEEWRTLCNYTRSWLRYDDNLAVPTGQFAPAEPVRAPPPSRGPKFAPPPPTQARQPVKPALRPLQVVSSSNRVPLVARVSERESTLDDLRSAALDSQAKSRKPRPRSSSPFYAAPSPEDSRHRRRRSSRSPTPHSTPALSRSSSASPSIPSSPHDVDRGRLHRGRPSQSHFPSSPGPSPPSRSPSPRRQREHDPLAAPPPHLTRYRLALPFRELGPVLIGHGGHVHQRILEDHELDSMTVVDHRPSNPGRRVRLDAGPQGEKPPSAHVELVGSRGAVRAALSALEDIVYVQNGPRRFTQEQWAVLTRHGRGWIEFDAGRCEDVAAAEARRIVAGRADRLWLRTRAEERRAEEEEARAERERRRAREEREGGLWELRRDLPFQHLGVHLSERTERGSVVGWVIGRSGCRDGGVEYRPCASAAGKIAVLWLVGSLEAIRRAMDEVGELAYGRDWGEWNAWERERLERGRGWTSVGEGELRRVGGGGGGRERWDDDEPARGRSRSRSPPSRRRRSRSSSRRRADHEDEDGHARHRYRRGSSRSRSPPRRRTGRSRSRSRSSSRRWERRARRRWSSDESDERREEKAEKVVSCEVDIPSSLARLFGPSAAAPTFIAEATGCSVFLVSGSTAVGAKGRVRIEGPNEESVREARGDVERVVRKEERERQAETPAAATLTSTSHRPSRRSRSPIPSAKRSDRDLHFDRDDNDHQRGKRRARSRSWSARAEASASASVSRSGSRSRSRETKRRRVGDEREGDETQIRHPVALDDSLSSASAQRRPPVGSTYGRGLISLSPSSSFKPAGPRAHRVDGHSGAEGAADSGRAGGWGRRAGGGVGVGGDGGSAEEDGYKRASNR